MRSLFVLGVALLGLVGCGNDCPTYNPYNPACGGNYGGYQQPYPQNPYQQNPYQQNPYVQNPYGYPTQLPTQPMPYPQPYPRPFPQYPTTPYNPYLEQ